MIALIRLEDKSVVQVWLTVPKEIVLPDGAGQISPIKVGWEGGGVLTYDKNGIASTGPARFAVVEIEGMAETPEGKKVIDRSYAFDEQSGKVIETPILADIPPVVEPTDTERLEGVTGLTVDQIKAVLGLK